MKRFIILLSVLFVLCTCLAVSTFAASGEISSGIYRLSSAYISDSQWVTFDFISNDQEFRAIVFDTFSSEPYKIVYIPVGVSSPSDGVVVWSADLGFVEEYRNISVLNTITVPSNYELFTANFVRIGDIPLPPYNPVTDVNSLVTNSVNWVSSMVGLVMNNPLILAYALLPILGVGIGLLVRAKNSNK